MLQENNRHEFKRFDKERRRDFSGMLKAFVINQVSCTLASKLYQVFWILVVEFSAHFSQNRLNSFAKSESFSTCIFFNNFR